ncbi:MAG: excinuclease ABC subunit UvrC [Oscillospiraceae bacterium]|nr:excinuclease ABC subunit UvrC [Oscillospiraceae bacterium]
MTKDELREKALALPLQPGVYIMMDRRGEVIYVGKAKKLKNRVVSYFREGNHSPKTEVMVSRVDHFDVIMVRSEFEALITENQLIKLHKPRYNILLKDDKGYPYLRMDLREDYPSWKVVGRPGTDGAKYLGPYGSRTTLFAALGAVNKALKLPQCSRKFPADIGKERPCLNQQMGLCEGWCTGTPDASAYRKRIGDALLVFEGKSDELEKQVSCEMEQAAEELDFEKAAVLRDRLRALQSLGEKQLAVAGALADTDALGFHRGAAKSCFVVLHYIGGKLLDKDMMLLETPLEEDEEVLSALVRQYYLPRGVYPKNILLPLLPEDGEDLARLFSEQSGHKVNLLVPQRGDMRLRAETARMNAQQEAERATDREERVSGILKWLAEAASLPKPPRRIEAYDISNLSGEDTVASMTVFVDTKPLKRDYRRFKMKTAGGGDDYGSMRETLQRRLTEYREGNERFSTLPDLFLIDGGSLHATVALEVLRQFGLDLPVLGMVKDDKHRTRALITSDGRELGLEGNPAAFSFIGRIQEETHRFAIEYQRSLRSKHISSSLDRIPGVGEKRRSELLKHFRTIKAISAASEEELRAVVPKNTAKAVYDWFRREPEEGRDETCE